MVDLSAVADSLWKFRSFLEENYDAAPAGRQKILDILQDPLKTSKLQLVLAAVIDAGEPFIKATYNLEGDGALVFNCNDVHASLEAGVLTAHFPNLADLTARFQLVSQHMINISCSTDVLVYNLASSTSTLNSQKTLQTVLLLSKLLAFAFFRR